MKRTLFLGVFPLLLLLSCGEDRTVCPPTWQPVATLTPAISGNELTFSGIFDNDRTRDFVDEIQLQYTTASNCDLDQWLYNYQTQTWVRFTEPTMDCGQVITLQDHRIADMGFSLSEYLSDEGEMKIRIGSDQKLDDATIPDDYVATLLSWLSICI